MTQSVYEGLLRRLADGAWSGGARLPPTRELERMFGVSHMTMLGALRQATAAGLLEVRARRPVVVAADGPQRAKKLLAETSLEAGARRIAVLLIEEYWPNRKGIWFVDLLSSLSQAGKRAGFRCEQMSWPLRGQEDFVHRLMAQGFAGAVAVALNPEHLVSLHAMREQRFPVVVVNRVVPEVRLPAVNVDEYGAARQIAEHLRLLGHRNMCMVAYGMDMRLMGRRHRSHGWLDYLVEAGLYDSCTMPICFLADERPMPRNVAASLVGANRPTALVFAYGAICQSFVRAVPHRELRVPEDMSLVTFDRVVFPAQQVRWPRLTSIAPEMGHLSDCVIESIQRMLGGNFEPRILRLPMKIDLTESVGPPRV